MPRETLDASKPELFPVRISPNNYQSLFQTHTLSGELASQLAMLEMTKMKQGKLSPGPPIY